MVKTNPEIFLDACRFDVPAKYIYASFLERNIDSDFGYNLYKEHLKVWNDWRTGDGKNGIQEYVDTFKSLLLSIKTEGFNTGKSLVYTTEDLRLMNGGHRVAACLLYGKEIWHTVNGTGQTGVNYEYFKNKKNFVPEGLSEKWCDAIAVEYCKLKPNTFIVTIFPSAVGKRSEAESIIKEKADIFYKKTIQLSNEGPLNLMKELYYGEAWGGRTTGCDAGSFGGLKQKVNLCFREKGPIVVYAITAQSYEDTRCIKEKIRKLYNISNHSVHVNDTTEQTVRLARCLFNNNSIHFMNNSVPAYFNNFESYIKFFKGYIEDNSLNPDDYCVTASSVLSRYGLREGNDLDYLHKGQEVHGYNMIHSHNSYALGRYHTSVDDIIYNPDNYFYFNGVKFASLDVVKKLKEKRMEEKDKKDLKLVERL